MAPSKYKSDNNNDIWQIQQWQQQWHLANTTVTTTMAPSKYKSDNNNDI